MATVIDLHHEAMAHADAGFLLVRREGRPQHGDPAVMACYARAVVSEVRACRRLPCGPDTEPTRTILHQSAASLATLAGRYALALRLCDRGLANAAHAPLRLVWELRVTRRWARLLGAKRRQEATDG